MVGDFMVCVDKVIASSACFQAVDGGGFSTAAGAAAAADGCSLSITPTAGIKAKKGDEVIECRICQEEGGECDLEVPCACSGTLKFAHRKCIQKWCNKKGNITCEICNQVFTPNYSASPKKPSAEVIAIDIRQSWGSRFDIHDSHFLAIAAAEHEFLNADYEDYETTSASVISCCRTAALILMLILLVRQILNATREVGMLQGISVLFNVSLQFAGLFLPCYMIAHSCYSMQSRRRRQVWFNRRNESIFCKDCYVEAIQK